MPKLESVFVSKKTFGKYTGRLEWYVKDNIWIDDCFKSTVTDSRTGAIIEVIDKIRPVPEKIKPDHIVPPPIEGEPPIEGTGKLWYFDPKYPNELYVFKPPLIKPVVAWVIKTNSDIYIYNAETGVKIGRDRVLGKNKSATLSDCGGNYVKLADEYFTKFGFSNTFIWHPDISFISKSDVQAIIGDPDTKYWFNVMHGSELGFELHDGIFVNAGDVEDWLASRDKFWFAFLGSCGALSSTGPGTISYAFRKGSMKDTVTIGANRPYSGFSFGWQKKMYDLVLDGETWGDAFDRACAAYIPDSYIAVFCGDRNMKMMPGYEGPKKGYIDCISNPSNARIWLKKY